MRNTIAALLILGVITTTSAQVIVNKVDINTQTTTMEVWAVKKPFSDKESFFLDFGQDKFRPHYYDHKTQMISDKEGSKFEKGQWMQLLNYLQSQGWEMQSERPTTIGEQEGRIITFMRKQ